MIEETGLTAGDHILEIEMDIIEEVDHTQETIEIEGIVLLTGEIDLPVEITDNLLIGETDPHQGDPMEKDQMEPHMEEDVQPVVEIDTKDIIEKGEILNKITDIITTDQDHIQETGRDLMIEELEIQGTIAETDIVRIKEEMTEVLLGTEENQEIQKKDRKEE